MEHDLVAHLYATALLLMREHDAAFLPLGVVRERLGWPDAVLGEIVEHCVASDPVAAGRLRAEWMDDGAGGVGFIGIRPHAPSAGQQA